MIPVTLSPWLVFLAVVVYGIVHSLLASLWAKARALQWLGALAERTYRLAYNIFAVISFLPVLALVALLPDRSIYTLPAPWIWLALGLQSLAGLSVVAGVLQTDPWAFLGVRQLRQSPEAGPGRLVVSGLYRWVRHPLYTAGMVFLWFSPVMTMNTLALNLGLTAYIVLGARLEERRLLHEFGAEYAAYQLRTPMLIPWPRR